MNYMLRINLNIAIVSMVKGRPKNNISLTSECIKEEKLYLYNKTPADGRVIYVSKILNILFVHKSLFPPKKH